MSNTDDSAMSADQETAIRRMAADLHRLNTSVMAAVDAGVCIELMRASRYHNEKGAWGDMMVPIIRPKSD